jgi:hypothetical protein
MMNGLRTPQATTPLRKQQTEASEQALCQLLCDLTISKLPRELRDLIYSYVLLHESRNISVSPACERVHSKSRARYWRTEYVGRPFLAELLEGWYHHVRFHIGQDIGFLERFVTGKASHLNVPRHTLITKLSITFDERDIKSCKDTVGEDTRPFSSRTRLLGRLEHLFLLEPGASIYIYAIVPNSWTLLAQVPDRYAYHSRKLLRELTTTIHPAVRRLKDGEYLIAAAIMTSEGWPVSDSLYHLDLHGLLRAEMIASPAEMIRT